MASPVILSNFFEKQWTQNHPQYLSGLSCALYPTNFLKIAVLYVYQNTPIWLFSVKFWAGDEDNSEKEIGLVGN